MTMRKSPRRPLILRRRKLPPRPAASSDPKEPTKPEPSQCFPDGIRIMDHPSMSDTQVVFIPKTADFQGVIQALTDEGNEFGSQRRNRFMLLCENGSSDNRPCFQPMNDSSTAITARQPVKAELVNNTSGVPPFTAPKPFNDLKCDLLDNSLTDIQWLGEMSACDFEPDPMKLMANKTQSTQTEAESSKNPIWERPPYSYMAMIQFAINSKKSMRMTLREIYTWIEDHFPYFKDVAKPGWKNSIRHNLSLHNMFIRETSPVGKISLWTIRPEANRGLTLDQVTRHQRILPDSRKTTHSSEQRMKSFPPRSESSFISAQSPVAPSVFMLSPQVQFHPSCPQLEQIPSRGVKRVRIAPKVSQSDVPPSAMCPQGSQGPKMKMKEEPISIKSETPNSFPMRPSSSSRRKQNLLSSVKDEPILFCAGNTFIDFDSVSDSSTFQDMDCCSPVVTPRHHHTSFSFSSPIKDWPLFTPPKELFTSTPSRGKGSPVISLSHRELLQAGGSRPTKLSTRKGLDDSLGEILVDLGFPCVDEEDMNVCNLSLSEILSLIK